jgi:hypothetical protein
VPIDVTEIAELEANVYTDPSSIRDDLDGMPIRYEKEYKDVFRNIVIPPGWFKGEKTFKEDERFFESQKMHFFKREELIGAQEGDVWFRGKIVEMKKGKASTYFQIFVKTYLGRNVATKNMLGAISTKFFHGFPDDQNFLDKTVEFILKEEYIGTGPLRINVELVDE